MKGSQIGLHALIFGQIFATFQCVSFSNSKKNTKKTRHGRKTLEYAVFRETNLREATRLAPNLDKKRKAGVLRNYLHIQFFKSHKPNQLDLI